MIIILLFNKYSKATSALVSILLALIIGAIIMFITGFDVSRSYLSLLKVIFNDSYDLGEVLRTSSPLILTGLSVAIAFRVGLFNIGVEGQFIIGQVCALIVALKLDLPIILHSGLAILAAMVGGAVWAFFVAILKTVRGIHEVITSIMLNFIALFLSNFLIRVWLSEGADSTPKILETASLKLSILQNITNQSRFNLGFFIAIVCAIFTYFLLWKSKTGYEIRSIGHNPTAAKFAGIKVNKNILVTFCLSGLFAGVAGGIEILGTFGYMAIQSEFSGIGFDGIAVALLAACNPLAVIVSSFLFAVFAYGGSNMQYESGVPFEIIKIIFAFIILFLASNISNRIYSKISKRRIKNV